MKTFSERNLYVIGAIGLVLTFGIIVGALQYDKLPFVNQSKEYSAYFAEAGGLTTSDKVQVSGFKVGQVKSIELDGPRVLVKFTVDKHIRLGDRTEAAIKTKGLLGTKLFEVTSRGDGQLDGPIPLERTRSPYQLPDALGDLATTISGLNTDQLSDSLRVLAATFADTPPQLRVAVEGVARFSQTLDERDAQLRGLLANANKATTVLAERSDQIVRLIADSKRASGRTAKPKRRAGSARRQHLRAQPAAARLHRREPRHLEARVGQAQRRPDDHRQPQAATAEVDQTARRLRDVAGRIGVVGPVLQGLRRQPAARPVHPAVRRCRVLRPRSGPQCAAAIAAHRPADRPARDTGAAGALSAHRPGRRAAAESARRDHRQPRRSAVRSARRARLGWPRRYPYREPLPAPPPGGPPPGPPALPPPELASTPTPTPSPVFVPAPGEVPPPSGAGQ